MKVACLALLAIAAPAAAEPLRLRGDALASVQAPAGLLVLEGGDRARPWIDAEAMVWTGLGEDGADGDALVVAIELRDPRKRGALRLGRFVVAEGALRPVHLDGGAARARLPRRFDATIFGGLPVAPGFGPRAYDWVVGARVARPIGKGRVGLAWLQRRDHGALHTHELAADGVGRVRAIELAAGAAWDLVGSGLAEAKLSAAGKRGCVRGELFAIRRSPSHLLPATSLFSVLGDVPATLGGGDVRWRAAPRLDVGGRAGIRVADGSPREDLTARATLRLDDRGDGALGVELRRQGAEDGGWSGVRGFARVPVRARWTASGEAELAIADEPHGRGRVWPWALAALAWRPDGWELAGALEAAATPEQVSRFDAIVRVSRVWEGP